MIGQHDTAQKGQFRLVALRPPSPPAALLVVGSSECPLGYFGQCLNLFIECARAIAHAFRPAPKLAPRPPTVDAPGRPDQAICSVHRKTWNQRIAEMNQRPLPGSREARLNVQYWVVAAKTLSGSSAAFAAADLTPVFASSCS